MDALKAIGARERQLRLNASCASAMNALDALGTLERRLRLHANCALAVNTLEAIGALERQMRLNANCALAVDALEALSKKSSTSLGEIKLRMRSGAWAAAFAKAKNPYVFWS